MKTVRPDLNKVLLLVLVFVSLRIFSTEGKICTSKNSESNSFLYGFVFETTKVDSILQCVLKCSQNVLCASINMNLLNMICELNKPTMMNYTNNIAFKPRMIYMEIRHALGFSPHNPIPSCKWLKNLDSQAKSGVYWMKFNEPSSGPFQVFCDMTTDGGGWTLVYSYTFTQYKPFKSVGNAVTPAANWPTTWNPERGIWVPRSTTIPLSESSRLAMDFPLWKNIGNEFLLKPNITNWVACVEGTGSLVKWVAGSVSCRVVKANTPICTNVTPNQLGIHHAGPSLKLNDVAYVVLEGSQTIVWPIHDPCGNHSTNQLQNIPNPGGALYIR